MKIKNLLLAGLAVAAMTACSNSEDFVDNSNQPEIKDATMQFGIAFPQNGTRAGSGDIQDGETEVGIADESAFERVTVVIKYTNGSFTALTYPRADFKDNGTGTDKNQTLYLKESIPVTAGISANIYAFINPSDALKTELEANKDISDLKAANNYTKSLDDLIAKGGIAESGKFLMSGTYSGTKTFTAGASEEVQIPVDRVAAKLVERSQKDAFTVADDKISKDAPALTIALTDYRFVNLQQNTYILSDKTIEKNFFEAYRSTASWDNYTAASKNIIGSTDATDATNITYCTENKSETTTNILYKAVATWDGGAAETFYVTPDGKVYLSFDALKKDNTIEGLDENSTIADFAAKGIKKYEDGVCYYQSDKIGTIIRNNVYYLNVTSISHLGDPTPGDPEKMTTIDLEVAINPWTIHVIGIEL